MQHVIISLVIKMFSSGELRPSCSLSFSHDMTNYAFLFGRNIKSKKPYM